MEGSEILRVVNIKIIIIWCVCVCVFAFIYGLFNSTVSSSVLYNFTWHKDTFGIIRRGCRRQLSWSVLNNCSEVKKVKCTLVQALRLCTGRAAHRGSRGIALLFHDQGTRRGLGVSVTPGPLFTPWKDPVHILLEAEWAPRLVWTGAENLVPTRIRSPDRPSCSQSLYQLSYWALSFQWVYL